ncbi:hypothetical protein H0I76_17190 [Limibaculum sp. M0105]|uniref:Lipoprotein n=1 Tax=Thermohalobaculum xanthum TaxID=2753746 RepID=A0A8J7SGI6_9RHOB|nr:hypothetical protein [Thermohalobaculum xanthum]MBK0400936.1 hypothetical protein [Thermohalobaculum xanthum]
MRRIGSIARALVAVATSAALVAGCASPRTKAEHRAALDACLASPDPYGSPACQREQILRQQMDYERSENASIAMGAFALSLLGLGIWAVVDDDNCCYGGRYYYYH